MIASPFHFQVLGSTLHLNFEILEWPGLAHVSLTMAAPMLEFRTRGFNPYAVKYSPYYDSRVAVASAANFGIVGNGRLFALGLTAAGIQVEKTYTFELRFLFVLWTLDLGC